MKKVKKILLVLAVIFAILTFIAVFLPFFINLNRFKPKIQAMVSEKMNAKIDFSSARLNLFGGLGLKLKDVSLENDTKPFAGQKVFSSNNVEIQFEFLPLFSHKFVGIVYLDQPAVTIIKIGNEDTLSSLIKPDAEQVKTNQPNSPNESDNFTLILNEFSVSDAHLMFKDLTEKSSPTIIDIKDIDLDITREGKMISVDQLSMKLFSGQLVSHIKINLAEPQIAYSGDCNLKNFSLADIYHSFSDPKKTSPINGTAALNLTFDGRGTTKDVYSKSLNGKGSIKIKTGELKLDTTLPVILDQLGVFLTTLPIPGFNIGISKEDVEKAGNAQSTTISLNNMQGNFEIKKGMLSLKNNISMVQGLLKLDVVIGIFTSSLKGIAIFEATDAFTKTLLATNKNFSYLLNKDGQFHLKMALSGTVSNPNISVDTSEIMGNILSRAAKSILNPIESVPNALKNTLKGIFGQ